VYNALIPGTIGIKGLNLQESIDLARDAGFEGVSFDVREAKSLADQHGVDHVRALFDDAGIRPALWDTGVSWSDDEKRDAQIEALKPLAELAASLGATNVTTGIMPGNDARPYAEEYEFCQTRLRPLAEALNASGIRIGIEFISPKTLRDRFAYEFIYTMKDMLAFAKDIGTGNVGVLFDVWHHYCAHGTIEDMSVLTADDVQLVHSNDAPLGLEIDEQQDLSRTLPLETGVIPAVEYLRKLKAIGYAGPVGAEPFSQRINDLAAKDPLTAAKETAEATRKLLDAI
jgi:sugar phosphate isomerase/epimerase